MTEVLKVPVERISIVDGFNPRQHMDEAELKGLASSITENGLLQPIVVKAAENETFELIAGHRRYAAAQLAGVFEVDAILRDGREANEELISAVVENVQRVDLNPMEEALAYHRLKSSGLTPQGIAQKVGVGRKRVTEHLELVTLPAEIAELIEQGKLGMGPVKALKAIAKVSVPIAVACAQTVAAGEVRVSDFIARPGDTVRRIDLAEAQEAGELLTVRGRVPYTTLVTDEKLRSKIDKLEDLLSQYQKVDGQAVFHGRDLDLDGARAAGALLEFDPRGLGSDSWDYWGVVVGKDILTGQAEAELPRELRRAQRVEREAAKWRKDNDIPEPGGGAGPDPDGTVKRSQDEVMAERVKAWESNQDLGARLMGRTKPVKLTKEVALAIAAMAMKGEERELAHAGLRLTHPGWSNHTTSQTKAGKTKHKVAYTEPPDFVEKLREFVEGAVSGEEVLNRLFQIVAAAHLASQDATTQSDRGGTPVGRPAAGAVASAFTDALSAPEREKLTTIHGYDLDPAAAIRQHNDEMDGEGEPEG